MKRKKVGTVTLAVGLITLGLLLFANNFMNIAVNELYKYWPVLIIGMGLEMFVFVIIYRHDEDVKLRLDGLCIALIIVAAIFSSNWQGFNLNPNISFNWFGNMMVDGVKYKSDFKTTIVKENISKDADINKLLVRNSFGDIKLKPYDQKSIKVEANVNVKYNDEQAAKDYVNNIVKITEGAQTEIAVQEYNGFDKNKFARASVDFVVYVPQNVYAEIKNSFGDIYAEGVTKDLTITNMHGKIIINEIGGNVTASNSFGDVEINGVGGAIQINNQHGEINASDIKGDSKLDTSFGDIEATNIDGNLIVKNNYGKIVAKNIKGNGDIRTSFGDIDASDIDGNTIVNDNNGKIELQELKGNVEVRNSFGDINYKSSNTGDADIYAKTSFGDIETNLLMSINKAINEQTAKVKTGNGKYRIQLITNNGDIDIK